MFHPDLRLLRCFAAIAETGSVTRAAERLHLTQSTLSGQIKELELALGFSLFHRTTRSLSLTTKGERILPLVRRILEQTEVLRHEVEEIQVESSRHFRLGAALYTMDFPERLDLLDAFAEAHPDIRFTIDNRLQNDQVHALMSEKLDVSLLLGIATPITTQDAPRMDDFTIRNEITYPDTLKHIVLRRRKIGLLVAESSPLAAMIVIPRVALEGQRVAMLSPEHGHALVDPIEQFLRDSGAIPVRVAEGNAWAIERYAKRHGICAVGVGWFPTQPGLVLREVEGLTVHLNFSVVLGTGANRAALQFYEFARKWSQSRLTDTLAA